TIDERALFVPRVVLRDQVTDAGEIEGVAVELLEVTCDLRVGRAIPRALTDPVAGVHRGFAVRSRRAEIRAPGATARAHRGGKLLAMGVRAGESAEIRAVPDAGA